MIRKKNLVLRESPSPINKNFAEGDEGMICPQRCGAAFPSGSAASRFCGAGFETEGRGKTFVKFKFL
jgi:hypothetical protein